MSTPVVLGTALTVGIGANTYDGYIVNEAENEAGANEEIVPGEDGETTSVIITDRAVNKTLQMTVKDGSAPTGLKIGDVITVNDVHYRLTAAPVTARAGTAQRVRLQVRKETSMTYVPPAP